MEITVTGHLMFEVTEEEFFRFPYEPAEDINNDMQNDYAVALMAQKLYSKLITKAKPNLQIKTYYGSIVVEPQIEEGMSPNSIVMPLSPWIFAITPTTPPVEKDAVGSEIDEELIDATLEDIEQENPEPQSPEVPKSVFNFKATVVFKAEIEATYLPITSYKVLLNEFYKKENEMQVDDENQEEFEDNEIDNQI